MGSDPSQRSRLEGLLIYRLLRQAVAIAPQPRCPGATRNISLDAASEITDLLQAAGFTPTRTEILDLDPPVVCVLAVNQAPAHGRLPDS